MLAKVWQRSACNFPRSLWLSLRLFRAFFGNSWFTWRLWGWGYSQKAAGFYQKTAQYSCFRHQKTKYITQNTKDTFNQTAPFKFGKTRSWKMQEKSSHTAALTTHKLIYRRTKRRTKDEPNPQLAAGCWRLSLAQRESGRETAKRWGSHAQSAISCLTYIRAPVHLYFQACKRGACRQSRPRLMEPIRSRPWKAPHSKSWPATGPWKA